jgi:hypothetical protein
VDALGIGYARRNFDDMGSNYDESEGNAGARKNSAIDWENSEA